MLRWDAGRRWLPQPADWFPLLFISVSSEFWRPLGALILVALTAADIIARSSIRIHFLSRQSTPNHLHCQCIAVRLFLTFGLASLYTALVFAGLGPWMNPLFLVPLIFVVCCAVAWRNLSLWYQEGEEFEEALAEAQHQHNVIPPNIYEPRAH